MRKKLLYLLLCIPIVSVQATVDSDPTDPDIKQTDWVANAFAPATPTIKPALFLAGLPDISNGGKPADANVASYVFARADLGVDAAGDPQVNITPLAPDAIITLNGQQLQNQLNDFTTNPANVADITNMVVQQDSTTGRSLPVLVSNRDFNVYKALPNSSNNTVDGTVLITNNDNTTIKNAVNDAAAKPIDQAPQAIAASSDSIFLAVPANGSFGWNDLRPNGVDRGIALLKPNSNTPNPSIDVYNATNFGLKNPGQAVQLPLVATKDSVTKPAGPFGPVAFIGNPLNPGDPTAITNAELDNGVALNWNSKLNRLYIGLTSAHRDDPNKEGGVLGLAMGYVDTVIQPNGQLLLQPPVSAIQKAQFYDNTANQKGANVADQVIGFYFDGVNAANGTEYVNNGNAATDVTVRTIRNMFTSTNKDYLIVNSTVNVPGVGQTRGIYALPVVGATKSTGVAYNPNQIGTLAYIDPTNANYPVADFDQLPTVLVNMPRTTHPAVNVGEGLLNDNVAEIFVQGDTVYMCVAGLGLSQNGIFAATALFDENGSIKDWTQPVRVYGGSGLITPGSATASYVEPVGPGTNIDTSSNTASIGSFFAITNPNDFVTNNNTLNSTVRISQWGKSDDVANNNTVAMPDNMSSLLATIFPQENGGVVGFFSFQPDTPGFNFDRHFAMDVVVGTDRIAIIQSARSVNLDYAVTNRYISDSGDQDQNVFVITTADSPALAAIAPLTCAEVSRMAGDDEGWLFIGGCNGVAVLSNDTAANTLPDIFADDQVTANTEGRGFPTNPAIGKPLRGLPNLTPVASLAGTADSYPQGTSTVAAPAGNNWSFKKLVEDDPGVFTGVLKLTAANGRMYVVTLNGIYYFDMAYPKFDGVPTAALGELFIDTLPEGTLVADLAVLVQDGNAANNKGVIATNNGLYASDLQNGGVSVLADQEGSLVLRTQLLGNNRAAAPTYGNVYALITDFVNNNDTLYRYSVDPTKAPNKGMVLAVPYPNTDGLFLEYNDSKQGSFVDGTFDFATIPANYGQPVDVTLYQVPPGTGSVDVTSLLNIDTATNTYGQPVLLDAGSGARLVPGDWGVRVNE